MSKSKENILHCIFKNYQLLDTYSNLSKINMDDELSRLFPNMFGEGRKTGSHETISSFTIRYVISIEINKHIIINISKNSVIHSSDDKNCDYEIKIISPDGLDSEVVYSNEKYGPAFDILNEIGLNDFIVAIHDELGQNINDFINSY